MRDRQSTLNNRDLNIKVKDVLRSNYNDSKEELMSKAASNLSRVNSQINDIPSFKNFVPAKISGNKAEKLRYSVEPAMKKASPKLETLDGLLSERVAHDKLIPLNRSVEDSIKALEKQRERNQTVSFRDEMDQAASRAKDI